MISITPKAAENILNQMKKQKDQAIGIRLGVKSSGCNGFVYDLGFIYDIEDDDLSFESNYISVVVNKKVFPLVDGTTIDFVKEGLNSNFIYLNPNKQGSCGCGLSFNVS